MMAPTSSEPLIGRTAAWLVVGFALVVGPTLAGACSLGEGVTPVCDPTLANGMPGACQDIAECDDGNGGVIPTDECCVNAANGDLAQCEQRQGVNFVNDCRGVTATTVGAGGAGGATATSTGSGASSCCNAAQTTFDICKQGNLSSAASGGGMGGQAGMGGMGGAMAGTGGAGGGTGGAGGAGGSGGAGGN